MWGSKDPRCGLTLDFWREAIPELRFVATYRHRADVASSLASRERIEVKTGDQGPGFAYDPRMTLSLSLNNSRSWKRLVFGFLTAQNRSPGVRTTGYPASN